MRNSSGSPEPEPLEGVGVGGVSAVQIAGGEGVGGGTGTGAPTAPLAPGHRPRRRPGDGTSAVVLPSGMAQPRNRPAVSLTLDPKVLEATRQLLAMIPGQDLSLSRLVDQVLRDFVVRVGPSIRELRQLAEQGDDIDPVQALQVMDRMFAQSVAELGQGYAAVRTKWEPKEGE